MFEPSTYEEHMGIHLSPEAWQELETEYRAGAPAKKLAQKYRVSPDTIFARSSRNKWRDSPIRPAEPTYVERLKTSHAYCFPGEKNEWLHAARRL